METIQTISTYQTNVIKKKLGGRPTKYDAGKNDALHDYLMTCQDQEMNGRQIVSLPTVEGFALFLGVSRDTLYQWGSEHSEFSDTLRTLKTAQLTRLINNGLAGNYNSVITKLLLITNHGMKEDNDPEKKGFTLLEIAETAKQLKREREGVYS